MFFIYTAIYISNQYLKSIGIANYFTKCFLNDLLFVPFVLSLCVELNKYSVFQNLKIGKREIVITVVVASAFFELILPAINHHSTGDILDVVCYMIGGLLFYLLSEILENKKQNV